MNIIHIQPALPAYRIDFFDRLADHFGEAMTVHYSPVEMGVLTAARAQHSWEHPIGPLREILPGLAWQSGALRVPIRRGDTLVICGAPRTLSNIALLLKARFRGVTTIWWGQYWSSTSKTWRLVLRTILMRLSDAVMFYTEDEATAYLKGIGVGDARPISGLNNGINVDPIKTLRAEYDVTRRPDALLFIGRLTKKAQLDILLRALATPTLAAAELNVIGGGPQEDSLRRQADALGISERVHWHGGSTDEAWIAAIANRCKLFVYPGGVGLSLIHAMAYGLPAVLHDDRWRHMPEFAAFKNGRTGLSFDRDDFASLSATIEAALSQTVLLEDWSRAATFIADYSFNTEAMTKRFIEMTTQLTRQKVR